jgi:hypothetical protein
MRVVVSRRLDVGDGRTWLRSIARSDDCRPTVLVVVLHIWCESACSLSPHAVVSRLG